MKRPRAQKTLDKRDVWERLRCAYKQGRTTTLTARDIHDIWNERERLLGVENVFNAECMKFQASTIPLAGETAIITIERLDRELQQLAGLAPDRCLRCTPLSGETAPMVAPGVDTRGWWAKRAERLQQEAADVW